MYIIKNALKNLLRNKGRNILLSVIILAIVVTTVVTLSIDRTAEGIIEDYHTRFGSRVILAPDMENVMTDLQQRMAERDPNDPRPVSLLNPQMTPQQTLAFAGSPYVMEYTMTARHGVDSPVLEAVDADAGLGGAMIIRDPNAPDVDEDLIVMPHFRLLGNTWTDFDLGRRSLAEGVMPQGTGEALISTEVAELNNLSVGDEIRLYGNLMSADRNDLHKVPYDLTIVGIYLDMTENQMFFPTSFQNRRNEVLTTLDTIISQMGADDMGIQIEATYYLHSPSYLAAFEAEMRAGGLDDLLLVSTDEAGYYAIVAPVLGLRSVARTFLLVVMVLGGIVLMILSSIAIRERKYEIGVLRAMGMKKRKVAFGLWTEMLALTLVCLIIGLSVGVPGAQPVSDMLLAGQVESAAGASDGENQDIGFTVIGGGGIFGAEETPPPLDVLDLSLRARTIAEITGISLALTSVAALAAIARITKYEPIKILMERD